MGRVGCNVGEEDGVGAEGVDVVETLGDAFEPFGAEAVRIDLVEDRRASYHASDFCPEDLTQPGTGEHLG
jgi:hypothetical protein